MSFKRPIWTILQNKENLFKNEDLINNGIKIIEHYLKRGYPFKQLKKHMLRAYKYIQEELLDVREKDPTKVPVMTTRSNPTNPNIKEFIHRNWNIIENSNECAQTFPEKPIIGFKRFLNPRDIYSSKPQFAYPLTEFDIDSIMPTHCTCLGKCTYCPIIKKIDTVTCNITGKIYHTKVLPNKISCELSDIVYLITCTKCNKY